MKGERDSVVVIPAIKTGPMTEEAFSVTMENCCMHRNFLDIVYPYIKKMMENGEDGPDGSVGNSGLSQNRSK